MVRVGVMQKAVDLDPTRIENSAARRAGRLVYRSLFEMLGAGIEGGEYLMPLGKFELSEDQLQLRIALQPNRLPPPFAEVNAFDLSDLMIARANPASSLYNPAWAGVLKQVSVPNPREVVAELRRPHVLPQAMLQIRMDDRSLGMGDSKAITGSYLFQESESEGVVFRFAGPGEPAKTQPREIYEITQPSGEHAITALMRGEIDLIDQLFPADAQRLRQRSEVKVVDYPLPTVHVLVPWSDHPFVTDRTTKRGMLLAINRELILTNELTEGTPFAVAKSLADLCQQVSILMTRSVMPMISKLSQHGFNRVLAPCLSNCGNASGFKKPIRRKNQSPSTAPSESLTLRMKSLGSLVMQLANNSKRSSLKSN